MRLLVRLKSLANGPANIPIDYRSRFISLLKAILREEYFITKQARPYTFAVYFGKNVKINKRIVEGVSLINFRFSTGDNILAIRFYNGVLKLKEINYTHNIGNGKFYIEWISVEPEKPVTGIFRTLSPVVVERIGFSVKNSTERYITPWEEGFDESLLENIMRRYVNITSKELCVKSFAFKPIKIKEEFVRHYGGYLKGFIGKFKIETDSQELLQFIYQYGLGLRTGQGFGYLEVEEDAFG